MSKKQREEYLENKRKMELLKAKKEGTPLAIISRARKAMEVSVKSS